MRIRKLVAALSLLSLGSAAAGSAPLPLRAGLASSAAVAATIVEKRTAAAADDAEEFASGSIYINSSDLELVHDSEDQMVGMRWTALAIPPGATISAAYIQFSAKESQSEVTNLTIRGQAADNAGPFTSTAGNVSTRARTSASTAWTPAAWSSGEAGANQRTPGLSAVIQEIVNRPGWASGNAIAIIVTGTGHRTAYAYDGSASLAPLLHIEYGGTPVDNPPVAALTVTQVALPALTVNADGSGSTDTDATPIASYRFTFGDATAAVTTNAPSSSAQHTYASAGTYTVTLIATDTGGHPSSTVSRSVTVNPPVTYTVEKRTTSSSDDAEESSGGSMSLSSSDLELIHDSSDQTVGMRWTSLAIPRGAHISAAYIQFSAKESQSEATSLTIRGQAADNAGTFTSSSGNVTGRTRTSASVSWNPVAWSSGEGGANQRTPGLSAVIQEIVNRPGWTSGNALAIIVNGTGHRTAYSYDGSSFDAPLLHVEFSGGSVTGSSTLSQVAVYAGYYDTHHTDHPRSKPSPWMGSSGVVFIGTPDSGSGGWDTSAIRIDNPGATSLSGVVVSVDMGSSHFALWGTHTIPAGGKLVLAQTGIENFDGSDTNSAGCYNCNPNDCNTKVSSAIPVVHVTIGSKTTDYLDTGQILNTHGVDAAGCPYTGTRNDESSAWTAIYPRIASPARSVPDSVIAGRAGSLGTPELQWLAPPSPNPTRGLLSVRFRTATRGQVRLDVYDVAGRMVLTGIEGALEAGEHHEQLDLSGAPAGIYYCHLWTPQGSKRAAFVLVR